MVERDLARSALVEESIKLLMTIPGIHMIVALAIKAAIGDVKRFARPQKLASYLGLNPSVRQSGPGPAYHGRITKQGRGHARGMLVEAAWAAARTPGPLRAFFLRVRARRGQHVAAVATARKLAILVWHLLTKNESYLLARPALHARNCAISNSRPGTNRRAAKRARLMPTISGALASRSGASSSRPRRRTLASSPAGTHEGPSQHPRCAQALQTRSDGKGCAAALSPSCPALGHAVARARHQG